jgi:probable rRNA maturation factor
MPALVTRQAPASPAISSALIKKIAERMLRTLHVESCELSILLTDDETIRALNREHRSKDSPTDVLSFPLMDPDDDQLDTLDGGALGDVVISIDRALLQADARGAALLEEMRALLAHGILHLLGYDHETDAEEAEMNQLAEKLVNASRHNAPQSRSQPARPDAQRKKGRSTKRSLQ